MKVYNLKVACDEYIGFAVNTESLKKSQSSQYRFRCQLVLKILLMLALFVAGYLIRDLTYISSVSSYQTGVYINSSSKFYSQYYIVSFTTSLGRKIVSTDEISKWDEYMLLFGYIAAERPSNHCLILNQVSYTPNLENYHVNGLNLIVVFDQYRENVKVTKVFPKMVLKYGVMDSSNKAFLNTVGFDCTSYMFLDSRMIVLEKLVKLLTKTMAAHENNDFVIVGNDKIYRESNNSHNIVELPHLNQTDLRLINSKYLRHYVFCFSRSLLSIASPLNFQLYSRYTLIEMLVTPIIAMTVGSVSFSMFKSDNSIMPSLFEDYYVEYREYQLNQLPKDPSHICFVSYPANPDYNSYEHLKNYLSSLEFNKNNSNFSVIVFLRIGQYFIWKLVQHILQTRNNLNYSSTVKVVLSSYRVVCSLSNYRAAYYFCPSSSIIVSSRHHVIFESNAITETRSQFGQHPQRHVLISNYKYHGQIIDIPPILDFNRRNAGYQPQYFNVQVFRSDRFKMINFWYLKCDYIDFYEYYASYMYHILEITKNDIIKIDSCIYSVRMQLHRSERQYKQYQNIRYYYIRVYSKELLPYKFNSLQNRVFKRDNLYRQLIPKKFHQIWIGNHTISPIRYALVKTMLKNNPDYEHILWRDENLTKENFPFTFELIYRLNLAQKNNPNRPYGTFLADVIRYEIIYQHGGIYLDFKTEIRKRMDPWLKYRVYFGDIDYQNYGKVYFLCAGHFGATLHHPTFEKVIRGFRSNVSTIDINGPPNKISGGFMTRKYFSYQDLFQEIGVGNYLLSPNPENNYQFCESAATNTYKQYVFNVTSIRFNKYYRIGIPCELYPYSYSYFYTVLGGTWKVNNRKEWN